MDQVYVIIQMIILVVLIGIGIYVVFTDGLIVTAESKVAEAPEASLRVDAADFMDIQVLDVPYIDFDVCSRDEGEWDSTEIDNELGEIEDVLRECL